MEVHHARAMEVREALEAANRAFESELRKVGDEQWGLPTPCGEWDVRALVNHVLLGTRMSIQILDGMPRVEIIAGLNDDMLGASTDPVADFNRLAAQMCQGFAGPDGLEGMVVHPAGDFPRAMFAGFRVTDGAAHAWDLGHAMGAEPTLDAEMLEFLWADTEPKREMLAATGMFGDGASGSVTDDAPLQARYLDLIGRRAQVGALLMSIPDSHTHCPIGHTTALLGDRWSMMIVREALRGLDRYQDLRDALRISDNTLTRRLAHLQDIGVLVRHDASPARYQLTDAGVDLARVLAVLGDWGMRWLPVDRPLLPVCEPIINAAEQLGFLVREQLAAEQV